jgi:hypothetical protein
LCISDLSSAFSRESVFSEESVYSAESIEVTETGVVVVNEDEGKEDNERNKEEGKEGKEDWSGIRLLVSWIRDRGTLRTGRQIARRHARMRMLMLLLPWWVAGGGW